MAGIRTIDCLEAFVSNLAGWGWSATYIATITSSGGNGVVSGAGEHFQALRELARLELGETPLPSRFCVPSDFDG